MPTLYFDTTKYLRQRRHRSGLNRVSEALQRELPRIGGFSFEPVHWSPLRMGYRKNRDHKTVGRGSAGDAFFSSEVFNLQGRPGCRRWMRRFEGRTAVLFHDAIPFFHPETTWPRSVRRFPAWFQDLQAYSTVFFVSKAAREEAERVHEETGWPRVYGPILPLGADYAERPPQRLDPGEADPVLLNVGIIEPRKGQMRLLEACEALWAEGKRFRLVFLGRVNPHFGKPIAVRIHDLQAAGRDIVHEAAAGDDRLAYWHQRASLAVLPSRAEGFGLPALESLWAGIPVLATRQPSLSGRGAESGVRLLSDGGSAEIREALAQILGGGTALGELTSSAVRVNLPRWSGAARVLVQELGLVPRD